MEIKQHFKLFSLPLLLISLFLTIGCNSSSSDATEESSQQGTAEIANIDASSLISTVCYACHNPKVGSHDEMLAPPLVGIKQNYLNATDDRLDFLERMLAFVSSPNEENALMKGPIKRFGLMPKTALSDQELKAIVGFIYDSELPEPAWFAEHEQEMHGTDKQ